MTSPFKLLILSCLLAGACQSAAADPRDVAEQVRDWRQSHEQQIVDAFHTDGGQRAQQLCVSLQQLRGPLELLSIPNVASDTANIRRNADFIGKLLTDRSFEVRLLEVPDAPPAIFAERRTEGASKTLLIYAHYDGQPANAADWASDPWTPVLRDGPFELGGEVIPMRAPTQASPPPAAR